MYEHNNMNRDTLHEIVRRPINVDRNEDASITWQNNVLASRSSAGINLFDFGYNLRSFNKSLDIIEVCTSIHKTSPAEDLFQQECTQGLPSFDFQKLLLDPAFWPHNDHIVQEMTRIVSFQWSPVGFYPNNLCVLATLNSLGSVTLLRPSRHKWQTCLNLSSSVYKFITQSSEYGDIFKSKIKNVDCLKYAVSVLVTSSIAWDSNTDCNQSYFVTAQKNGTILIWKLICTEKEVVTEVAFHLQTEIGEIPSIIWLTQNDMKFYLICSNIFGQAYVAHFEKDKGTIRHIKIDCLWKDKDKMISNLIEYQLYENKIILLYNKHRHLIVQFFDENFTLISQKVINLNDYKITSIAKNNEEMYLTTVNCQFFRVNLTVVNNTPDIKLDLIKIKETHPQFELHSISFSHNNLVCALAVTNKSVSYKKKLDVVEIVFASWDLDNQYEVNFIINNPSKSLTNAWDYIEILKYKIMKAKLLPSIDYNALYQEAKKDIYKLKVYHILITIHNNIKNALKSPLINQLPEKSEVAVKERLFAHHAKSVIDDFWQRKMSGQKLNETQTEYICGAKNYLEYYCKKYKEDLAKFVPNDVFVEEKFDFICQCCDEKIIGLTCKYGHKNIFCSLTFSLIETDDYLKCRVCGLLARGELFVLKPKCIMCDIYFEKYSTDVE